MEEKDWIPSDHHEIPEPVRLRIGFEETVLREKVKGGGGTWDPKRKLWQLAYPAAMKLRLLDRVVERGSEGF